MKGKAKPSPVHVSLDNADTVIEGGPHLPAVGKCEHDLRRGSTFLDPTQSKQRIEWGNRQTGSYPS